jgi:hypothetical protein
MTNTPPRKKARSATPRAKPPANLIANHYAKAMKIRARLNAEEKAEKARQVKRAAARAALRAEENAYKLAGGSVLRNSYLQRHNVATLVSQHLTPRNTAMAAIAFRSPAFKNASRARKAELVAKLAKYQALWRPWYKSLSPNNRTSLAQNIARVVYNGNVTKSYVNPLLMIRRSLSVIPRRPNLTNEEILLTGNARRAARAALRTKERRHNYTWGGALAALNSVSGPEMNAVFRKYKLPFVMSQARNNLSVRSGISKQQLARARERSMYHVPPSMSLAQAAKLTTVLPLRPPKGLKGYAGKRARRSYRARVAYMS